MLKSPLFGEIVEELGCELGALVGPDYVWCSCATECVEEGGGELGRGGVVTHVDDVRPVGVAVDSDKEGVPCVRAEVHCNFFKRSGWSRFHDDRLLWLRW